MSWEWIAITVLFVWNIRREYVLAKHARRLNAMAETYTSAQTKLNSVIQVTLHDMDNRIGRLEKRAEYIDQRSLH